MDISIPSASEADMETSSPCEVCRPVAEFDVPISQGIFHEHKHPRLQARLTWKLCRFAKFAALRLNLNSHRTGQNRWGKPDGF